MTVLRSKLFAALLAVAGTTSAHAVPASGDLVLYWNEVLLAGVPYTPAQQRPAAMVNIALHDAINATLGHPDRAYLGPVATAGGDTRAAAAVAAHNVLVNLYPGRAAQFDAALATSLALVPDSAAKTSGIATGATIAAATITNRANDGSFDIVPYMPSGLPGRWAPTPPGFAPPVMPQQATVTPFVMASPSAFRAAPPPALDSAEYTAAFNEVKAIGSTTSAIRTADESASAVYWAQTQGPGPWITAGIAVAATKGLSMIENARLFALLSTSVADAITAAWDTKFFYDYWRPVTAIRLADFDGNAATDADTAWSSLIVTPPHQSYLSAHSIISGAAATILDLGLGDSGTFCIASGALNRCWDSFGEAAIDSYNSRLWGGVHFRFDNVAGFTAGQDLARAAYAGNAFDAVPEPATWAMLLIGFGATGAVMRRSRRASSVSRGSRADPGVPRVSMSR